MSKLSDRVASLEVDLRVLHEDYISLRREYSNLKEDSIKAVNAWALYWKETEGVHITQPWPMGFRHFQVPVSKTGPRIYPEEE